MKFKPKFAAKHVGHIVQQNSPTLLSAVAVVGVAATGYFTLRATWRASTIVDDAETDRKVTLTTQERALLVWKLYIPAAGVGALTIGCIVASNRIQVRRLAALAAAYGVLSGDFDEYRNKALEMLGDKKAKAINDKIAEEKMLANPPPQGVFLEEGKSWFCDLSTMRYFKSERQKIDEARNDLNRRLLDGEYADLNEFYAFLSLDATNVGNQLGWNQDDRVEVIYSAILMRDGSAATGFSFSPEPRPDFDSLH